MDESDFARKRDLKDGPAQPEVSRDRRFFGQPLALANLFGVEMWERFSFYGMQGILIYYLYYSVADGGLGISQAAATSIVGAYGGTSTCRRSSGRGSPTAFSAPNGPSSTVLRWSCPATSRWRCSPVCGASASVLSCGLGQWRAQSQRHLVGRRSVFAKDERRDAGFSIFYMGINIGGLVGPLLTGALQDAWDSTAGFALAAVGMALGLMQYTLGRKHLHGIGEAPGNPLPAESGRSTSESVLPRSLWSPSHLRSPVYHRGQCPTLSSV